MNRSLICITSGLVACGGGHSGPPIDAPPPHNPAILYLAPDQGETHVKLVDTEPAPF